MEKMTFKQLNNNIIHYQFGYNQIKKCSFLDEWIELSKIQEVDDFENTTINRLQEVLIDRCSNWNEFELSEWFIGPLMSLVNFNTKKFKLFAFREISAIIKDVELIGRPDVLIAQGLSAPINPYFCFHEYKKEIDAEGHPQTQLLGAMMVAQSINGNDKPIYGIYVIGIDWRFIVLKGNEWIESKKFVADDEEIIDIFKILKALKEIINNLV